MISWIAAGFLVAGFIVLARLLGLAEKGVDVVAISRRSLAIIRNPGLSDETKETALQKNAARLFRLAFDIALGGTMSVCAPLGILWLADRLGLISLEFACAVVVSPAFIGAGGLLIVIPLAIAVFLERWVRREIVELLKVACQQACHQGEKGCHVFVIAFVGSATVAHPRARPTLPEALPGRRFPAVSPTGTGGY